MRYDAVSGPELSAAEIGWILTVIRTGGEPIVQAVTVAEVVGDLRAMIPEGRSSLGAVMALTDEMIESLEERVRACERQGQDARELRERASELRRELEAIK
jgi:hypothetical protein